MVEQQTAARFEETKYLRQWNISNDERRTNDSLAGIESALAFAEVRESEARLERFNERRTQMMVITQEGHGPEITLARLADVEVWQSHQADHGIVQER